LRAGVTFPGPIDYAAYPLLLVDDEPENLQAFCLNFRDEFTIDTADSGARALAMMDERDYAVIVSDQRMPAMTGVDLLEKAAEKRFETIRVILTGYTDQDSLIAAVNRGRIYHYITKPWNPNEITLTLRRAIEAYALAEHNRRLIEDLGGRNRDLERIIDERTRQLRVSAERHRRLAITDGLTGLYNHRHFQERWRKEVKRAARYGHAVSLMIIDVDSFKNFNDTMGHPQGDVLLREISTLLCRSVRDVDVVARYGGEEFVIVLPETRKSDTIILAERIRSIIGSHPFDHRDVQPAGRVTVSIGVSNFPEDGSGASDLIVGADKALYRAKQGGRDRVVAAQGSTGEEMEGEHDLDLIVEEDGDTRVAAPSAMDAPIPAALDPARLRARQAERQGRQPAPPPITAREPTASFAKPPAMRPPPLPFVAMPDDDDDGDGDGDSLGVTAEDVVIEQVTDERLRSAEGPDED
jgi:diguanylate cyclase (GGDEF)-like protein